MFLSIGDSLSLHLTLKGGTCKYQELLGFFMQVNTLFDMCSKIVRKFLSFHQFSKRASFHFICSYIIMVFIEEGKILPDWVELYVTSQQMNMGIINNKNEMVKLL